MQRVESDWECYSDMIQGGLDGISDALSGIPRCANANRSHSYRYAYGDGYTSAKTLKAKARDEQRARLAGAVNMPAHLPLDQIVTEVIAQLARKS